MERCSGDTAAASGSDPGCPFAGTAGAREDECFAVVFALLLSVERLQSPPVCLAELCPYLHCAWLGAMARSECGASSVSLILLLSCLR